MRTFIVAFAGIVCLAESVVFGQSPGGLPRVGSQLPDVSAFDAEGRPFALSELRGEYSVLVFGCLT